MGILAFSPLNDKENRLQTFVRMFRDRGGANHKMATLRPAPQLRSSRTQRERSFTALGTRTVAERIEPGLHIVATPIGNLGDVTLRALQTLAAADAVLAEDTRVSRQLLGHFAIDTQLIAYHEHNAAHARPRILSRLAEGQAIALISDAGTPLISDPGYKLVVECVAAGFHVRSLPGPSAVLTALTSAGLPTDRFFFEGFLPQKSVARRKRANALACVPATLVFYEAPSRLAGTLADLAAELGPRRAAVARELTKLYEETRRGDLPELAAHYARAERPRGEIVIVVGPPLIAQAISGDSLDHEIQAALEGLSTKDAAAVVAARTGLPRREVYARALRLVGERQ
jgi:16S rRNA (cytidine1402-2'-O)-methyltransferase